MKTILTFINILSIILLTGAGAGFAEDVQELVVRWPAAAGVNYPADPEVLLNAVRGFYDKADVPEVPFRLAAVVASAAPYGLAGEVSAHAFKSLQPGQYERVIIIAPSHGPLFENCSIPAVDIFLTPLGPVALDDSAVRYLLYSPLFHSHQLRYTGGKPGERIHEYEFAIESLLPYLQERLLEFKLVPILVGDLRDPQGKVNPNTIRAIADTIHPIINERTLLVISTSFTHCGVEYGNLPEKENLEDHVSRLDRLAFEKLLALDFDGFRGYLAETNNFIDGKLCMQIMLKALPEQVQARLLAYDTSMAKTKEPARSISYGALVFHDLQVPALLPQPEKVRPLVLRRPEKIVTPEGDGGNNVPANQESGASPQSVEAPLSEQQQEESKEP